MSVSREEECFERHRKPLPLQCADRADMRESQSHMVMFPNSLDMPFVRFREVPRAEISLVELGDYTCPVCRQAAPVVHSARIDILVAFS